MTHRRSQSCCIGYQLESCVQLASQVVHITRLSTKHSKDWPTIYHPWRCLCSDKVRFSGSVYQCEECVVGLLQVSIFQTVLYKIALLKNVEWSFLCNTLNGATENCDNPTAQSVIKNMWEQRQSRMGKQTLLDLCSGIAFLC